MRKVGHLTGLGLKKLTSGITIYWLIRNIDKPLNAILCGNINCKNLRKSDLCMMYNKTVNRQSRAVHFFAINNLTSGQDGMNMSFS